MERLSWRAAKPLKHSDPYKNKDSVTIFTRLTKVFPPCLGLWSSYRPTYDHPVTTRNSQALARITWHILPVAFTLSSGAGLTSIHDLQLIVTCSFYETLKGYFYDLLDSVIGTGSKEQP